MDSKGWEFCLMAGGPCGSLIDITIFCEVVVLWMLVSFVICLGCASVDKNATDHVGVLQRSWFYMAAFCLLVDIVANRHRYQLLLLLVV